MTKTVILSDQAQPSDKPKKAADKVAAIERAVLILDTFGPTDRSLSLAELSTRSGLYKSTILRIAASLIRADLLARLPDGRYRLGAATAKLGDIYRRSVAQSDVIVPIIRELAEISDESVGFYVLMRDARICLYRVNSKHALRYDVREGYVTSLKVGSGGAVLLAFSGADGEPYETIRREFCYDSLRDPDAFSASISAPVFGPGRTLVGAISLVGPRSRVDENVLKRMKAPLLKAAALATRLFGEHFADLEEAARRAEESVEGDADKPA